MYYNAFMTKIKPPSVAGMFYSSDAKTLKSQIKVFKENSRTYEYKTRAVIVPHAGLVYSGQLAYQGLSQLQDNLRTLIIFAPAHRVGFQGLALSSYDEWQTPLGNIRLNKEIINNLQKGFSLEYNDSAFEPEHSVEIQIPMIQSLFNNVEIVPILAGQTTVDSIENIITKYWDDDSIGFVISSDLSHFLNNNDAEQLDNLTADMIESGDVSQFQHKQACGATGICALTEFANKNRYSLIRCGLINSSLTTKDETSVVGYGCWFLYEGERNNFLKKYYSNEILKICEQAIKREYIDTYPIPLDSKGACFVTLEKQGHLRGCIGSIIAHRSLILDLVNNSQAAAFKDPRFNPVNEEEIQDLSYAVSLLSHPKKMQFTSEEDLLSQIEPFKDGIIIKDGNYQAVYLPSVWEQLPIKEEFLQSLKLKAGMPANYFSETFEAYRFYGEYIK